MDRLLLDLRLGFRRLRLNPGFSLIAIVTLALGIGANTAIFSALNAMFLRPLPVHNSAELVSLNETIGGDTFPALSFPNYRDIRDRNTVFSGMSAYRLLPASVGTKQGGQRVWGYLVTGDYFSLLGVAPLRGRILTPDDDKVRGGHPVVVLSYNCWQTRFGGEESAIGRKVTVNGRDFTILGVMPKGFIGTELYAAPEVFFPMAMQKELEGGSGYLDKRSTTNSFVVARRKPGVSFEQASAAMTAAAKQLAEEYPQENGGMKIVLSEPGLAGTFMRGPVLGFAGALFGVAGLVLLLACTNLASMLLARAADRRKETAIRLALGAARMRLVRQLLTENLLLSLGGGIAGALVAVWVTAALGTWRPPVDLPIFLNVEPDERVMLFALGVSVLTALLFGLVPALQATRPDLVPALKNEVSSERQRQWHVRDLMVAAQVGLSALLLVCAITVIGSLRHALEAPIGFDPQGAVTASFDLNIQGYDPDRGRDFDRRLLEQVRDVPGVESAALIDALPLSLNSSSDSIYIEGQPVPKPTEAPIAYSYSASPDYFRTMHTRLLAGREFGLQDRKGATRVAIVNETFAKQLVRDPNPIGKRFRTDPKGEPMEIVGLVQDGKYFALSENQKAAFWLPLDMFYSANASLVVRARHDPAQMLPLVRSVFYQLDPAMALYSAGPLAGHLDVPLFPPRVAALALASFGGLAVVLAATGIYGILAYAVARRTREIGIRMAVGATQSQVLSSVGRRAAILVGSGTVIGLAASVAVAALLGQVLYGVDSRDPWPYLMVLGLMALIAAAASWIPARRAIRIDPMRALREE